MAFFSPVVVRHSHVLLLSLLVLFKDLHVALLLGLDGQGELFLILWAIRYHVLLLGLLVLFKDLHVTLLLGLDGLGELLLVELLLDGASSRTIESFKEPIL